MVVYRIVENRKFTSRKNIIFVPIRRDVIYLYRQGKSSNIQNVIFRYTSCGISKTIHIDFIYIEIV